MKGNEEKLLAYSRLLKKKKDLHGKVSLVMALVPAAAGMRVYNTALNTIKELEKQINDSFGKLDWMPDWKPVEVDLTPKPPSELMAYYKAADICWTTPLRDGLNLVAKEYVVAHEGQDGVLVLSEFVGAAVELPDAVLTNPYSPDEMDKAIEKALFEMSPEEQKKRMSKMYQTVTTYDVKYWADRLLGKFQDLKHETIAAA